MTTGENGSPLFDLKTVIKLPQRRSSESLALLVIVMNASVELLVLQIILRYVCTTPNITAQMRRQHC